MNDWRPGASLAMLRRRARMLADIRAFFAAREVLEVQTPAIGSAAMPDPNIPAMTADTGLPAPAGHWYLQSSPEAAMKRLLAAGSGAIYQVSPAFRAGEAGRLHNPEFTLLEWYRPGFDDHRLMDELAALLEHLGIAAGAERSSYRAVFLAHAGVDPFTTDTATLAARAAVAGLGEAAPVDRDGLLDFLMATRVSPRLGLQQPVFVHDYPASQAALARLRPGEPPTAARFELFIHGIEIANGYHELTDADEQAARFEADNARRRDAGQPEISVDARLLAALRAGLPDCAGVAVGLERLLMVMAGAGDIRQVLSFDIDRA